MGGCSHIILCTLVIFAIAKATKVIEKSNEFDPIQHVKFNFYSSRNQIRAEEIVYGNIQNVMYSYFWMSKPSVFLIHGLWGNSNDEFNNVVRKAILTTHPDMNIISVDWSVGARGQYEEAVANVPSAAARVVEFIKWLKGLGHRNSLLHLVGFSLGGQMAAAVARGLDEKIPFLMALDPADRSFTSPHSISPSDAQYVEVLHTSSLSVLEPAGHNDFYANTLPPLNQPGCRDIKCSHLRAYHLFAESIGSTGLKGVACTTYAHLHETCNGPTRLYMGGLEPKEKLGIFYLETNSEPPFAKE